MTLSNSIKSIISLLNDTSLHNHPIKAKQFDSTVRFSIQKAFEVLNDLRGTVLDKELFSEDVCNVCRSCETIQNQFERNVRSPVLEKHTKDQLGLLAYNLNRLNRFYAVNFSLFEQTSPHYISWDVRTPLKEESNTDETPLTNLKEPEPEVHQTPISAAPQKPKKYDDSDNFFQGTPKDGQLTPLELELYEQYAILPEPRPTLEPAPSSDHDAVVEKKPAYVSYASFMTKRK